MKILNKHTKRLFGAIIALAAFLIALFHHALFFPFILLISYFLYKEYFTMFRDYLSSYLVGIMGFWINSIILLVMYLTLLFREEGFLEGAGVIPITLLLFIPALLYMGIILQAFLHVLKFEKNTFYGSFILSISALLYLTVPLLCALFLFMRYNRLIFLIPFFVVWLNDSFAYYLGSFFGKRKIAPYLSPNKTYMGTFGSVIITTMIFLVVTSVWQDFPMSPLHILIGIPLLCLVAHLGDFTESGIKRSLGVKDSGRLIPGHGGILDRLDSLLFVITCFIFLAPML